MGEWMDKTDDLTPAIEADHPGNGASDANYDRAMKLVGNRHSKGALVALVNHLLCEIDRAHAKEPLE